MLNVETELLLTVMVGGDESREEVLEDGTE